MEVTDGGIGSFFKLRHPSNKHSSIYSNEIGIDIFVNDSQFLNAQTPIDSTADGIAISHNFLHPSKAKEPILKIIQMNASTERSIPNGCNCRWNIY
ncbi:hypothetical protein M9Y10_043321 [Tritrichomonas musculus]|uniref:Uncharacterized protein n=1 Tax=Tritrichomonas musculus TaxID=1915356 RepID=A0ABR2JZD2_9EUKA